jgi:hypothetical protein
MIEIKLATLDKMIKLIEDIVEAGDNEGEESSRAIDEYFIDFYERSENILSEIKERNV